MKKRKLKKALWWILPAVAVLVIASILAFPSIKYAVQGRVTTFDFRQKGYTMPKPVSEEWWPDYLGALRIAGIEKEIRSCGVRDGETIAMPAGALPKEYHYGAILVVTPLYSENLLIYGSSSVFRELSPDETYPDYNTAKLQRSSAVLTTVRIEEVLYQTDVTDYRPGDTVKIQEKYFVLDQRVPKAYEEHTQKHGTPVSTLGIGWYPLENGETYLVYGRVQFTMEKHRILNETICTAYNDVYCLSDPDKPAGSIRFEECYAEGQEYIRKAYDLTRYENK
ncbi:MAG: hypothetical protein IJY28_07695 [Clostridia bacterium]|nr:hypothetical protein [Clostridia bacterium]